MEIIIDGKEYKMCEGCELYDGEYCIGDRLDEPNGIEHSRLCDRHVAQEFWKVRRALIEKIEECESLKSKLKSGE